MIKFASHPDKYVVTCITIHLPFKVSRHLGHFFITYIQLQDNNKRKILYLKQILHLIMKCIIKGKR